MSHSEGAHKIEDKNRKNSRGRNTAIIGAGLLAVGVGAGLAYHGMNDKHYAAAPMPAHTFSTKATEAAPSIGSGTSKGKDASSKSDDAKNVTQVKAATNPDDESCSDKSVAYKGDPGTDFSKIAKKVSGVNKNYSSQTQQVMDTLGKCGNRIYIPQVNSLNSVVPEGFTNQFLNVPPEVWRVGWDSDTKPLSSTTGNTLIAGHVDIDGITGPFSKLSELKPGALIYTADEKNKVTAWRVQSLKSYDKLALPDSVTSASASNRTLTLVTCGGDTGVVRVAKNGPYRGFLGNVVVTAAPVAIN